MMPNKTYELRNLYFQQSQYSAKPAKPSYPLLLQWPQNEYFDKFRPDAVLLQKTLSPIKVSAAYSVADQIFGNQKKSEYLGLKHSANLFYERCRLHKQHVQDIDHRHLQIQEKLFSVEINNAPDKARRLSGLESQLLQLEQEKRTEEIAFWKDTVELREKLFEGAGNYRAAKHRYGVFSEVEDQYGR